MPRTACSRGSRATTRSAVPWATTNSAARTGTDTLAGGTGNGVCFVDASSDVVISAVAGEGNDRVNATVDYVLSDNVENLAQRGERGSEPATRSTT